MNEQRFQKLLNSVEQAAAYQRGEQEPARVHFVGEPDPREIRGRLDMTQKEFAHALGISTATLQNWEQGRRDPSGPAMQLLKIVDRHPELLQEVA